MEPCCCCFLSAVRFVQADMNADGMIEYEDRGIVGSMRGELLDYGM